MIWFISASVVSLFIGLVLVNLFRPGEVLQLQLPGAGTATDVSAGTMSFRGFITHVFPQSIAEAMASNEILQIVVFALFFGVATAALGARGAIIVKFLDAVCQAMFLVTGYVMKLAPLAVFAAMAAVVAREAGAAWLLDEPPAVREGRSRAAPALAKLRPYSSFRSLRADHLGSIGFSCS